MTAEKTFDVAASGDTVLYFNGHPDYDALRVDFDSANSTGTDVDVTFKIDADYQEDAKEVGYGSLDATVKSVTAVDPSGGDPSEGNTALGRTVAVKIDETSGVGSVAGTVYAHNASDPAQNADAFAQR